MIGTAIAHKYRYRNAVRWNSIGTDTMHASIYKHILEDNLTIYLRKNVVYEDICIPQTSGIANIKNDK